MKKTSGQKIVILGCGNVAWHLAKQFRALDYSVFVYNHKANTALTAFRSKLKCTTGVGLKNVIGDADYYFVCVPDRAIASTAEQLQIKNPSAVLMHTSGSMGIEELGNPLFGTGVFYPLQTFSKNDTVSWPDVAILIEASDVGAEQSIMHLARQFSRTVLSLEYKERLKLHLAAVIVNNFTNALYAAAFELSGKKNKLDSKALLLPLIRQTVNKLETLDPLDAQTGPAKRGDEVVMEKHISLLAKHKDIKKIYKQLSQLISRQQEPKHA